MDEKFAYFYPIIIETQLDFEGRPHDHEVFCEGHIVFKGRLICGESREVVVKNSKATKSKEMPKRATTPKLCLACQEGYRNNPESPYYRFVHGTPVKVTAAERNVVGAQA